MPRPPCRSHGASLGTIRSGKESCGKHTSPNWAQGLSHRELCVGQPPQPCVALLLARSSLHCGLGSGSGGRMGRGALQVSWPTLGRRAYPERLVQGPSNGATLVLTLQLCPAKGSQAVWPSHFGSSGGPLTDHSLALALAPAPPVDPGCAGSALCCPHLAASRAHLTSTEL